VPIVLVAALLNVPYLKASSWRDTYCVSISLASPHTDSLWSARGAVSSPGESCRSIFGLEL